MWAVAEAIAAAVWEAVLSIGSDTAAGKSGEPDDPGRAFDELFDWKNGEDGVPYWRRGPQTFDDYLQRAFWDQTESGHATGYLDPGWAREARIPTEEELRDDKGRLHRFADHNAKGPPDCELRGISNGDVRRYLRLPVGGRAFAKAFPAACSRPNDVGLLKALRIVDS